jgi:hypothetical protein
MINTLLLDKHRPLEFGPPCTGNRQQPDKPTQSTQLNSSRQYTNIALTIGFALHLGAANFAVLIESPE